jgi:Ni,Fe-hydrogenase III component G
MTLEESLKALKTAFSGKSAEAEAMSKDLSEAKAKNETLTAEFEAMKEKLEATSAIVAERDSAIAKIEELTKALASAETVKAEAVAQIETVAKKSASIVAAAGVVPVEISSADNVTPKSNEEIWTEYCGIKNPTEKVAFYNKHRSAIISHLGIK